MIKKNHPKIHLNLPKYLYNMIINDNRPKIPRNHPKYLYNMIINDKKKSSHFPPKNPLKLIYSSRISSSLSAAEETPL